MRRPALIALAALLLGLAGIGGYFLGRSRAPVHGYAGSLNPAHGHAGMSGEREMMTSALWACKLLTESAFAAAVEDNRTMLRAGILKGARINQARTYVKQLDESAEMIRSEWDKDDDKGQPKTPDWMVIDARTRNFAFVLDQLPTLTMEIKNVPNPALKPTGGVSAAKSGRSGREGNR